MDLSAAGLIVTLKNMENIKVCFPIPLVQLRGTEISAGNIYCPPEYIEGWRQGYIDGARLPDFRMFTQPRLAPNGSNLIIGADLRDLKERETAVRLIAQSKAQALVNASMVKPK